MQYERKAANTKHRGGLDLCLSPTYEQPTYCVAVGDFPRALSAVSVALVVASGFCCLNPTALVAALLVLAVPQCLLHLVATASASGLPSASDVRGTGLSAARAAGHAVEDLDHFLPRVTASSRDILEAAGMLRHTAWELSISTEFACTLNPPSGPDLRDLLQEQVDELPRKLGELERQALSLLESLRALRGTLQPPPVALRPLGPAGRPDNLELAQMLVVIAATAECPRPRPAAGDTLPREAVRRLAAAPTAAGAGEALETQSPLGGDTDGRQQISAATAFPSEAPPAPPVVAAPDSASGAGSKASLPGDLELQEKPSVTSSTLAGETDPLLQGWEMVPTPPKVQDQSSA